ncbi:MAG: class I SAM-dependent methyltransferase [Bacteriovorax sp.]|nr:class I SAM-dependent methyltransferase [Bacteriovorax sp.]
MENNYSKTWYSLFMDTISSAKTNEEIEFIRSIIPTISYPYLLDLCCGTGRHIQGLSQCGYKILGIDSNGTALDKARELNLPNVTYEQNDIFNLSLESESLNAVICMWQSFGYGDESQNSNLLKALWHGLKQDGVFLLDIYNKDFFERFLGERIFEISGVKVTELKEIFNDRLKVTLTYENTSDKDIFNWKIFSPITIQSHMREFGFELIGSYSSFSKSLSPSSDNPRAQYLFRKNNLL